MDPQANRDEAARIKRRIRDGQAEKGDRGRLEELDEAYANWLSKGGAPATQTRR